LWDPTAHNITINIDVIFDESSLIKSDVDVQMKQEEVPKYQQIQFETSSNTNESEHEQVSEDVHKDFPAEEDMADDNNQRNLDEPQTSLRRYTWVINPSRRYDDFVLSVSLSTNDDEPSCYQEAVKGSNSDKWKEAMNDEMNALAKNATWDLVELPRNMKIVGRKWVYKLKKGVDDKVERYKARLVAKGYSQKEGIDFHEIFSPVVNIVSIQSVLALVALLDLELEQLDVNTAFLHGDLDEEIYMEHPEVFVQNRSKKFVCRLKKSLYGLRKSPTQCYKKFDSFMVSQNYTRSEYNHCVYFKKLNNGIFIILVLYVDDMILARKSITAINWLKDQMAMTFDMKNLGAARQILGMEIFRDRRNGKLWLSQQKYVEKILLRFGMRVKS
jgi:hypothetical protein